MRAVSASLWMRSMPRVGSSSSTAAAGGAGEHHLEREPLALAAGEVARVGVLAAGEPGARTPPGARLVDGVLVDQVVARVLEQQRDLARALDAAAASGSARPFARRSSVLLPAPLRPISATRSPGASASVMPRSTAGPSSSSCQTPRSASAAAGPRRHGSRSRGRRPFGSGSLGPA